MIANRRCCRPGSTRFIACFSHHSTVHTYRMTKLTDHQISPVELAANNTFYMIISSCCFAGTSAGDVFRLESLRLQTTALGVLCFLRRSRGRLWLAIIKQIFCRQEFSDGKHAASTFPTHPDLLPDRLRGSLSSALTRWAYPMPCLPFFLQWISYQATAHSTSYTKPLVWTYRTKTMTQKTEASLQAANSIA
jgi:hypothetical protein